MRERQTAAETTPPATQQAAHDPSADISGRTSSTSWFQACCAEYAEVQETLAARNAELKAAEEEHQAAIEAFQIHADSGEVNQGSWLRQRDVLDQIRQDAGAKARGVRDAVFSLDLRRMKLRDIVEADQILSEHKAEIAAASARSEALGQKIERARARVDQVRSRIIDLERSEADDIRGMVAALIESDDAALRSSTVDTDITRIKAAICEIEALVDGLRAEDKALQENVQQNRQRARTAYKMVAEIAMREALPMDALARFIAARQLAGHWQRGGDNEITLTVPAELVAQAKRDIATETAW